MIETLHQLNRHAEQHFCRLPVLVTGEKKKQLNYITEFLKDKPSEGIAWVSPNTPTTDKNLSHLKATNVIGREYQYIVYDIDTHFDPNLFAALSGTLRGGGLFLILCTEISQRIAAAKTRDHFFWRFSQLLFQDEKCIKLHADSNKAFAANTIISGTLTDKIEATTQQTMAIQDIIHVIEGHRNRPYVLLADRGRGKSAALGLAASELLKGGLKHIILTAPSLDACRIAFKHLALNFPQEKMKAGIIQTDKGSLSYIPPDELMRTLPKTSLLIVDEAAGISASILERLLQTYSRIVFATTLHGYEGSGQFFSVNFFKQLDHHTPGWKKKTLTTPIRWASNDPLEALTNSLFLLKPLSHSSISIANTAIQPATEAVDINAIRIEKISPTTLINNENKLSQLYALLSSAHYKTQPSDLQHILNEPNIHIFLTHANQTLLAAAFAIEEGGIDEKLGKEIAAGNRRIKGNVIPQTLAMHLGLEVAAQYRYLRIMRIAVLPLYQRKKFGSSLIKHVTDFAENKQFDAIGCTFSCTNELLLFWSQHQFTITRLGSHRKANAHGVSALMLKSLTSTGKKVTQLALQHFRTNFDFQLRETHRTLDYRIILTILKNSVISDSTFTAAPSKTDILSLSRFAQSHRQLEDNLSHLNTLTRYALAQPQTFDGLSHTQLGLLVIKILQQKNWQETCQQLHLSGKKEGLSQLKSCTTQLLEQHNLII